MTDIKKLLELRKAQKAKQPDFFRQDYTKKDRLARVWRKPKGVDSKLRKHMHGHGFLPSTGYRGPAAVRYMHKSGLMPIIVNNVKELDKLDPKVNGAIIASTVGKKKKVEIVNAADAKSIRIFNYKDNAKFLQAVKDTLDARKKKTATKVAAKAKAVPKPEKKTETKPAAETQEEKKEQEKKEAEKVVIGKQ